MALVHVGRLVEASESYHALLRDETVEAPQRDAAERALADLDHRIAQLTLQTTGPTDGVAIVMDGHAFSSSLVGTAAPTDPGDHVVEARRADTIVASLNVHLTPGERETVELAIPEPTIVASPIPTAPRPATPAPAPRVDPVLAATQALEEPQPPPASHHEIYEEWWLWTLVGVVAVGAAGGIAVGVIASEHPSSGGSLGTIDGRP